MSTTISVTPRLRMTRHSPTPQDRTATSLSEAGPSRLPDLSQLVNVTLKDMDVSDDNMYASDVPTEPNRQPRPHIATPPSVTRADNPAAVLRALLSRLPNHDETSAPVDEEDEHQYPSEKESDYDVETASGTTSVAQSSLKNIFSRALREPGDTPRKDWSHRRRSSSIGATDAEDTPHIVEARDIKGKRRSLSDDEVENANKSISRPRTRVKTIPQPLTKEFLRRRFEKSSPSRPINSMHPHGDSVNEIIVPSLGDSQGIPPAATSTPQQSLRMSWNNSKFQSNLLEPDSEMRNVFEGLDSSADNMSDRSISPVPTLQIESEPVDDNDLPPKFHDEGRTSTIHHNSQTSFENTPKPGLKELPSSVHSAAKSLRSNSGKYDKHDSLGEQTMSLSLPAGHAALKLNATDYSTKLPQGNLSYERSASPFRPASPLPGHHRPRTPIDVVHDRERNWNKPHLLRNDSSSSSHLPRPSSALSLRSASPSSPSHHHGRDSPLDLLPKRERDWNSPHPTWHDGLSPHRHSRNSLSSPRPNSPMQEYHHSEGQVDVVHERERNWNAPHPKWHDGSSLHVKDKFSVSPQKTNGRARANSPQNLSHEAGSVNGHPHDHRSHSPQMKRDNSISSLTPGKSSSSLARSPSLHVREHDSRSHRSPSPLPTFGKKQDTSPFIVNGNSKNQPATPVNKKPRAVRTPKSVDRSSVALDREDASCVSPISSLHSQMVISEDNLKSVISGHSPTHATEADDMRETDFSSPSEHGSPKFESYEVFDSRELQAEQTSTPKAPISGRPSSIQDSTPPHGIIADCPSSPSTPPQRTTPKNAKLMLKTPSPPKGLPDLPTPSSSDESSHSPVTKIPKLDTPSHSKWMQTPKPPGGWLATPKAPVENETILDDASNIVLSSDDKEHRYPQTPVTQFQPKTPKPPGGWTSIPGPAESKPGELNTLQDEGGQRSHLLTPVNSLTRSAVSNLKTPGVPGGWMATPAARKSVMKVRFDPSSPEVQDESASHSGVSELPAESDISEVGEHYQADGPESGAPPSPRSPRRPKKANIRVLDAFGREETPTLPKGETNPNRTGIRVLDPMGRELKDIQPNESKKDDGVPPSRDELISKLKQGLGGLVEDINDPDEWDDILGPDRTRIQELVATSRHARGARQRLHSQRENSLVVDPLTKPPRPSLTWKRRFALLLLQIVVFFVMYRVAVTRARNLFFKAYYDPFNPELHLYIFKSDNSLHLPRFDSSSTSWPRTLLSYGRSSLFDFVNIPSYMAQLWPMDEQNKVWPPT